MVLRGVFGYAVGNNRQRVVLRGTFWGRLGGIAWRFGWYCVAFWVVLRGIPHFEGWDKVLIYNKLRARKNRNFPLLILLNLQK